MQRRCAVFGGDVCAYVLTCEGEERLRARRCPILAGEGEIPRLERILEEGGMGEGELRCD